MYVVPFLLFPSGRDICLLFMRRFLKITGKVLIVLLALIALVLLVVPPLIMLWGLP
jgi:hypothetical protein